MKITALMENTAAREGLLTEHGLSLYIETGDHRILFDAGQSGAFADNAEKLGVDLAGVDIALLSHGHYDHGGGFPRFLEINPTAKFYVNHMAFRPHFNAAGKPIGLEPSLRETGRVSFVSEMLEIGPGFTLHPGSETRPPECSAGLQVLVEGSLRPDDFSHEQYLLVEEAGKRILISGCSHRGVVNIMERFRPDVFVGGFHTKGITCPETLASLARELARFPTVYYTCHCTGGEQYGVMRGSLGDRLHYLGTGASLRI